MKAKISEYKHHLFWFFWPILGLRYLFVENVWIAEEYFVMQCSVDHLIPFREEFILPYWFWYAFMGLMHLYLFYTDTEGFKRYSKCLCLLFAISTFTFLVFPSCQELRPEIYPRDNFLTDCVKWLHSYDTNTNVCPSEHVIGSIAVVFAAINNKRLKQPKWFIPIIITALLICISTLFLKQHSLVDVIAAIPVCWFVYIAIYEEEELCCVMG